MAVVKGQGEPFSWLDNSFMSVDMKSMDISQSAKRNCCSALPCGKRKMSKIYHCEQNDRANDFSDDALQREFDLKCDNKVITDLKKIITSPDADENKKVKVVFSENDPCVSVAADGGSEVFSVSKQDQSMASLVFINHFLLCSLCSYCDTAL